MVDSDKPAEVPAATAAPADTAPVETAPTDKPPAAESASTSPPVADTPAGAVAAASGSAPVASGADVHLEVDDAAAAPHDEFDEQLSSFTASLSSSVFDYPVEHGRRYHAFRSGAYMFPNDEAEQERLDLIHVLFCKVANEQLFTAPLEPEKVKTILDIGTGTGVWALEMGDAMPHAEIIGNDLSPVQTNWVPPNVKFEVDDVESEWTYDFKFDFIFCRYMTASIVDWPALVKRVYANLAPGGWAEFQEQDFTYRSDDGSFLETHSTSKWVTGLIAFLNSIGRDCHVGPKVAGWVQDAGFVEISNRHYKIPIGPWAKNPKLKEIGMINLAQLLDGLEALSLRPLIARGYSKEEITVMLSEVRNELKSGAFHAYYTMNIVTARKPE